MAKGKKGGKKKDSKSKEPSAAQLQMQELAKRFWTGYQKRAADAGQQPIASVEQAVKSTIKELTPFAHIVLDSVELFSPQNTHSRLDPLFVALLETGYPFLKELYLWNLTLRNEDALCLARYVRQRRDFTKMELLGCKFTDDKGLPSLAEGLGFNKHIQKLHVSFVPLGTEGMRVLALELAHNETLRELKFHRCGLGPDSGELLFRYLAAVPVTTVDLEGNSLGPIGLRDISKVFPSSDVLQELSLQENGIDVAECDEGEMQSAFRSMCDNLMETKALKTLNLSFNTIGDTYGQMVLDTLLARKEKGLPGVTVKVGHRMRSEIFSGIAAAGKTVKKKGKKKGGKKKKKK